MEFKIKSVIWYITCQIYLILRLSAIHVSCWDCYLDSFNYLKPVCAKDKIISVTSLRVRIHCKKIKLSKHFKIFMKTILTNQEHENTPMSSRIHSKWDTAAERAREREWERAKCLLDTNTIRVQSKVRTNNVTLLVPTLLLRALLWFRFKCIIIRVRVQCNAMYSPTTISLLTCWAGLLNLAEGL